MEKFTEEEEREREREEKAIAGCPPEYLQYFV